MGAKKLKLQRAALEDHQRVGKELIPPFLQIGTPMEQVFWWRDLLPEFLWIDALVLEHGEAVAVRVFADFLSAADRFNAHPKNILDGTVSAFRLINKKGRQALLEELKGLVSLAVLRPFGQVLSLYPQCPMAWMAPSLHADRDSSIAAVRDAVVRLSPGKNPHAGFCRALPLHRLLAHHKIRISSHLADTIEAIKSYPYGDKYRAETFARTAHGMYLRQQTRENSTAMVWSRSFWNSNLDIAPCTYE